jgi:membrane protein YdbS with pleckstrin-like domain
VSRISESFQEQNFVLLRKHGSALVLPVVLLFIDAAIFFFVDWRMTETWQHQTLLGSVIVFGLLFWFLPSVRFFTNRYELTSTRIVIHFGIFGTQVKEVPWGEITGVSVSRGVFSWMQRAGDLHLHREFGQDVVLKRAPRAKKLARDFELYLAGRSRHLGQGK